MMNRHVTPVLKLVSVIAILDRISDYNQDILDGPGFGSQGSKLRADPFGDIKDQCLPGDPERIAPTPFLQTFIRETNPQLARIGIEISVGPIELLAVYINNPNKLLAFISSTPANLGDSEQFGRLAHLIEPSLRDLVDEQDSQNSYERQELLRQFRELFDDLSKRGCLPDLATSKPLLIAAENGYLAEYLRLDQNNLLNPEMGPDKWHVNLAPNRVHMLWQNAIEILGDLNASPITSIPGRVLGELLQDGLRAFQEDLRSGTLQNTGARSQYEGVYNIAKLDLADKLERASIQ